MIDEIDGKPSRFLHACWMLTAFIFGTSFGLGTFEKWKEVQSRNTTVVRNQYPAFIVGGTRAPDAGGIDFISEGTVWVDSTGIVYVNSWSRPK